MVKEQVKKSPRFIKPEGSDLFRQHPATGSYPQPDQSTQHTLTPFPFEIHFGIRPQILDVASISHC